MGSCQNAHGVQRNKKDGDPALDPDTWQSSIKCVLATVPVHGVETVVTTMYLINIVSDCPSPLYKVKLP